MTDTTPDDHLRALMAKHDTCALEDCPYALARELASAMMTAHHSNAPHFSPSRFCDEHGIDFHGFAGRTAMLLCTAISYYGLLCRDRQTTH